MVTARRPPLRNVGLVAAGGALGAVARVALAVWLPVTDGALPWTTFVENVVGAFALALTLAILAERVAVDPAVRLVVCTGALGAFTTYSTLAVELDRLVDGSHGVVAAGYAATSVAAGLLGALAGLRLGRGRAAAGAGRSTRRPGRRT